MCVVIAALNAPDGLDGLAAKVAGVGDAKHRGLVTPELSRKVPTRPTMFGVCRAMQTMPCTD